MKFTPIDWKTWPRGQYFDVHFNKVPNIFSMTVNIDISTLLEAVKDIGTIDGFHLPGFLNELQITVDYLAITNFGSK